MILLIHRYTWLKDGQPLSHSKEARNDGTLVFKDPSKVEEGVYQCLVESPLGVASSRLVHVRRAFIDTPKVNLEKHTPVEGKTYKLDCKVPNAYPKPEVVWYWQTETGKEVVQGQRFVQAFIYLPTSFCPRFLLMTRKN